MCKGENQIYKLTDVDKSLISEYRKIYTEINNYGFFILDNFSKNKLLEDYELTIYSGIYKILELLDTLEVMTENGLINSAYVVGRAMLENIVQVAYMIVDAEETKKRATILQMLDIKRTTEDENLYFSMMDEKECYKDFVKYIKDKKFDNWYSFSEEKRTKLKDLFKIVGFDFLYTKVYKPLCRETHMVTHMENNIVSQEGMFYFKRFRSFENSKELMKIILVSIIPIYSLFFEIFETLSEKKNEWEEYSKGLKKYF